MVERCGVALWCDGVVLWCDEAVAPRKVVCFPWLRVVVTVWCWGGMREHERERERDKTLGRMMH